MSSDSEDNPDEVEEDNSEQNQEESEVAQNPAFTRNIKEASGTLYEQLSEDLDLEEQANDLPEDKDFSRREIRQILSDLARREINANRTMYRGIIYQNLSNQKPNWDKDIGEVEKANKIDELIDTSIQVWVDKHIEEFVQEIEKTDGDSRLDFEDIKKLAIGAGIIRGIIERVTSEAIYSHGKDVANDVVDWFANNTPLNPNDLFNAVEAMLRALFGV
jgi:hypothetical protein